LHFGQNMMSKVIKNLPADPYDFLIKILQALQKQKKKVHHLCSANIFLVGVVVTNNILMNRKSPLFPLSVL